jgi:hypothetical protein
MSEPVSAQQQARLAMLPQQRVRGLVLPPGALPTRWASLEPQRARMPPPYRAQRLRLPQVQWLPTRRG